MGEDTRTKNKEARTKTDCRAKSQEPRATKLPLGRTPELKND